MKNFKLASFFSALLLGSLSHMPLNAWRVQDHATMKGTYDNRLTVYFDGSRWRKANGHFLDHRKFPQKLIQNIEFIDQANSSDVEVPDNVEIPDNEGELSTNPHRMDEFINKNLEPVLTHSQDTPIKTQQATPQPITQEEYNQVRNAFHNNLIFTNINDIEIFDVLYSRCPQVKNDIENMVIPVTNRLGVTNEAVDELVNNAIYLIGEWQPYKPLIDLIAEMPENSVHTINLHNGLNTLKRIFNERPDWYDFLKIPAIRAYFKKCIIDQEFDSAQSTSDVHNICAKIVQDVTIVNTFPQTILTKCTLYPKLFNALITEGKKALTSNETNASFLYNLEILGEKLTPNQILQIENNNNITAALELTCNYVDIEQTIHNFLNEDEIYTRHGEWYHDIVTNFFKKESIQIFFNTNLTSEQPAITAIINNFFDILLTSNKSFSNNPLFFKFYTELVSSVSFNSINHLQAIMSPAMVEYFFNHWDNYSEVYYALWYKSILSSWDAVPQINIDVLSTILNNAELCELIFSSGYSDYTNLLDFIKSVIENSPINIKDSSLFLIDNMDVFTQIIKYVTEYWDDIHDNSQPQPYYENAIITTLGNLIADLANLYTRKDRKDHDTRKDREFKDHGFIEWVLAAVPNTTSDHLYAYINAVITPDNSSRIDTNNNWPGRAYLLKQHNPEVSILNHVASMIGLNCNTPLEELNAYLNHISATVIPTISDTTITLLEQYPAIATWVFDIATNDELNRITMLNTIINNQNFDTITKYPRLTRLIFNKHIKTQQDLDAAIKKYTQNDDTIIQEEIDIALEHGLYEFKYTTKGNDPDYDPNYTTYPVEKLFDNGKLKELAEIVAACAGVDGWFYTTSHSNRYLTTAIQTVMSWLLTGFYDKPELDWTDPNINKNLEKLLNLRTDTSDTNFKFRDSELLHYAVYDNALFNFVMNNPQACIDLSALITNAYTTQDEFAQAVTNVTQNLSDNGYLAHHLIKIFIHAHTTQDIINDLVSWLGHLKQQKGSPEFNQILQNYMEAANEEIAKYPNAHQLGTAHIAMIKDIIESEAQEKTIAGRFKAFCRWGQKYHPKAAKVALSSTLFVSNGLTSIGKTMVCAAAPLAILNELATQAVLQTFKSMGYDNIAAFGLIITSMKTIFSNVSLKDLENASNWTSIFTSLMTNIKNLARRKPQNIFAQLINHGDYAINLWIQDCVKQLLQAVKQVVMNFIGNNGGWENFYKTATMDNNDIRNGKGQQDLKNQVKDLAGNAVTNVHYIKIGANQVGQTMVTNLHFIRLVFDKIIEWLRPTDGGPIPPAPYEPCTALVDPNPEQGPTHVDGYNEIVNPNDFIYRKDLGYAPEQEEEDWGWVLEAANANKTSTALVDPGSEIVDNRIFSKNLGDDPQAINARMANSTALVDPGSEIVDSEIVDIVNNLIFRKDLGYAPMQTDEDHLNKKVTLYEFMLFTKEFYCDKNMQLEMGPFNKGFYRYATRFDLMLFTKKFCCDKNMQLETGPLTEGHHKHLTIRDLILFSEKFLGYKA